MDVDVGTYNIQTEKIEWAISKKTKAIFLALWLIEDNCDTLGSKYDEKYTSTFGHVATFSFYLAPHINMEKEEL